MTRHNDADLLIDFYAPHKNSLMISRAGDEDGDGNPNINGSRDWYSPECGGGGCGTIVCATPTKRNGQIVGCGGGCGGCSILTVCG